MKRLLIIINILFIISPVFSQKLPSKPGKHGNNFYLAYRSHLNKDNINKLYGLEFVWIEKDKNGISMYGGNRVDIMKTHDGKTPFSSIAFLGPRLKLFGLIGFYISLNASISNTNLDSDNKGKDFLLTGWNYGVDISIPDVSSNWGVRITYDKNNFFSDVKKKGFFIKDELYETISIGIVFYNKIF